MADGKVAREICLNLLLLDTCEKSLGECSSLLNAGKRILGLCNICYVMMKGETKMGKGKGLRRRKHGKREGIESNLSCLLIKFLS